MFDKAPVENVNLDCFEILRSSFLDFNKKTFLVSQLRDPPEECGLVVTLVDLPKNLSQVTGMGCRTKSCRPRRGTYTYRLFKGPLRAWSGPLRDVVSFRPFTLPEPFTR